MTDALSELRSAGQRVRTADRAVELAELALISAQSSLATVRQEQHLAHTALFELSQRYAEVA